MARLIQLALLGVLVTVAITMTAAAAPVPCTHAASSVGPAVLIEGRLARDQSNLRPSTTACVSAARVGRAHGR
jgi:hypothetical protein